MDAALASLTARADLVAEANHRIANNLTLLIGMVRMQSHTVHKKAEAYSNAEVRHLLNGIAARIMPAADNFYAAITSRHESGQVYCPYLEIFRN